MKLKLVHTLENGDRENWRFMAVFQVESGETLEEHMKRVTPADSDMDPSDTEDWEAKVLVAAMAAGINIQAEGSGVPGAAFSHRPYIREWSTGSRPVAMFDNKLTKVHARFITIEQTGGLDI